MNLRKSVLAVSIMMAISGSALAVNAQWVDKPSDLVASPDPVRQTVSTSIELNENLAFAFKGKGNNKAYVNVTEGSTYTVGLGSSVWATSTRGDAATNAQLGLFQTDGSTFANNGNIYLSVDNQTDWWAVKAAYGNGGSTLTNNGLIYQ